MSVIIFGPAGCGKTKNAEILRKHFKCKKIVDGACFSDFNKNTNCLYLTNEPVPESNHKDMKNGLNRRVISFNDAMRLVKNER